MNLFEPQCRAGIIPRDYQNDGHDKGFRLWDSGIVGSLYRIFTGGGKTLMASLAIDTWLRRGDHYRALVVSYERQLVHQFAQEIRDYIGIEPGIEMEAETATASHRVVVASRQSILAAAPPTPEQIEELDRFGVKDFGAAPKRMAETCLKQLRKGVELDAVRDYLAEINGRPEACEKVWSRLHKFDWRLNWLVVFDEAHRHAYHLLSVGHIVDWFEQNPMSRRLGLTATPKRGDGVSIGSRMFPGIAVDYPLYSRSHKCAVKDGYAVPYIQKYIEVEGVDFKSPELVDKSSESGFDDAALALELEKRLTHFVGPMLELAGERKTLIFSPGVDMAKAVAHYINARVRCACPCGETKWYARPLIGDGAACACGNRIEPEYILKDSNQARHLDGSSPDYERNEVYQGHQDGEFQFLSVCGLCREGYNDPDIACVAIFRPVSKKASGLAEQMKGRGCRVLRELARRLHQFPDAAARRKAISESAKPDCLIIDLVGITGLADCASTAQIYAEGLDDEIIDRANQILAESDTSDVEEAIDQAEREEAEEQARIQREREEAEAKAKEEFERRAKAQAEARFTQHEVGYGADIDPNVASPAQIKGIAYRGMTVKNVLLTKKQAGRIIDQLEDGIAPAEVARTNRIDPEQWEACGPSGAQRNRLIRMGTTAASGQEASILIGAKLSPDECEEKLTDRLAKCRSLQRLDFIGRQIARIRGILPGERWDRIVALGKQCRARLVVPASCPPDIDPACWNEETGDYAF